MKAKAVKAINSVQKVCWEKAGTPKELQGPLAVLGAEYPIREGRGHGILVSFKSGAKAGTCTVTRKGNCALIEYDRVSMALRAVGALLAGLVKDGGAISEESPFTCFGIMLDCSRNGVMTVEHFKKWLSQLALLGYNMGMLYTEDTYQIPGEPFFGYMRGAYTASELREIDKHADSLGIEMIPCIQTLGHLAQVLAWPAYGEVRDTGSVLLAGEEKTYALIGKMLDLWKSVFKSKRIHVGMDETHDLGRGRYMDLNGYKRGFDIFNGHLAKVTELCDKRGLKPMIWSDMYFRMGSKKGEYYDKDCIIPKDVAKKIPKQAELVYWDYYHNNKEFYLDWIQRHRELGFNPLLGSGVWTWSQLWYNHTLTTNNAIPCIDACREAGLKELFFTMWGDDGAYCDFDSAIAGLAMCAEKAYAGQLSPKALEARLQSVAGRSYSLDCLAAGMNDIVNAPACLWEDPMLAIFLHNEKLKNKNSLKPFAKKFAALSEKLAAAKAGKSSAASIRHAVLVTDAIAKKISLVDELYDAYKAKNTKKLKAVRASIKNVKAAYQELEESFRSYWLRVNKPFCLEVQQIRFAGHMSRLNELERRLGEFLGGKVCSIPEIEENLGRKPVPGLGWSYRRFASGSQIL